MSALYPCLDSEVTSGAAAVTPGGDDVMSSAYGIPSAPPMEVSPQDAQPSSPAMTPGAVPGASHAPVFTDKRKLVYIGIRNFVICRDMTNIGSVSEVWRHEMGETSALHLTETYVVYSGDVVVARYMKTIVGLDPLTGAERWSFTMKEKGGLREWITMVATPFVVYVGAGDSVMAISSLNGTIIWEYRFDHFFSVFLPTIVVCGLCVFIIGGSTVAYLNASDGSVIWKNSFRHAERNRPSTAAWDGANRVLVGVMGYVYPYDLKTGAELEKINLKGTGYNGVTLAYDNNRRVFYALSCSSLFAISGGDDNHVLWKCETPRGLVAPLYSAFTIEPTTGRAYVFHYKRVCCVDTDGKVLFSKDFSQPSMGSHFYAITQDLLGSGMIFVGSAGYLFVLDSEGNQIFTDDLPGMRYAQTYLCTKSSSVDPNSSGQETNRVVWATRQK